MFEKVLVAVDGSLDSDRAVRAAADIVRTHGSEFHICHVFHIPESYVTDLGPALRAAVEKDGEDILAHAASLAKQGGAKTTTHLLEKGHPAEGVLDLAEKLHVELIVVGVRGKTVDQIRSLGSVSTAVARQAKCSVLLIRRT